MRTFDPDEYTPEPDFEPKGRFDSVFAFKEQLRRDYEGMDLRGVLPGDVVKNDFGSCYRVASMERGALRRCDADRTRRNLLGSFGLIRGIRDRTRVKLQEQGFSTMQDLENHPRFCGESKRIRDLLANGDTAELAELLGTRLSRSDPAVLGLTGMHEDSDFLFLDLETMGLFAGQPLVVAGLASLGDDNIINVEQYVVRDFADELAVLAEVNRRVAGHKALVTFNGKAFDLPFLTGRSAYYGIGLQPPPIHFDLLHFCRRAWRGELESCSLGSIEQEILGITRETDLPGQFVPEFYHDYLLTGNAGFLKPIVDHNRQDVISLVNVLSELVTLWAEREE